MATEVLSNVLVLAGGYDLSGAMNAAALKKLATIRDGTVLSSVGRVRKAGLKAATLRVEGFYEGTVESGLAAGLALTDVPCSVVHRATEGEIAYMFRALWADFSPVGGEVDDMARMSLEAESSQGILIRGVLGAHRTAAVITGTGPAFNLGAVAAGQSLYGALHVLSTSAGDTLDVTIESDALEAFGSPTTVLTFAQKTAIGSEWATPIAGPLTDTWWRAKWTIGGVDPSFAFAVIMGIQ